MSATRELRQGPRRYIQQRRKDAIRRVHAFEAWKRHGFDRAHVPDSIPSDSDFRIAREARR